MICTLFLKLLFASIVVQLLKLANTLLIQVIIDKVISQIILNKLQIIGSALETEVNYLPESEKIKNSLSWLEKFGNKEVDLYSDWLIVSKSNMVNNLSKDCLIVENNELGKIQILKANGHKCDRCWHYQNVTVKGIEDTKLCKRCANILSIKN